MTANPSASGTARQAADSGVLEKGARIGLAARGLVYVLIGLLAGQVAFGGGGGQTTDQQGALQKIVEQPFGKVLLWLVAVGFLAYGAWRLGEAAFGRREEPDEKKRTVKRIESLCSGLFYLFFCVAALRVATGSGGSGKKQKDMTARLLDASGGKTVLIVIGLVIIGVSAALAWRGWKTDFEKQLDKSSMSGRTYDVVRRLGQVGYIARGAVFGLVGVLVVKAALDHDPNKAGGLDVALRSVAAAPYGKFLLLAAAAGLICFGLYSFAESRYRRL